MIRGDVMTAVDLGSHRITALMLEWRKENTLRFLACYSVSSEGVEHGEVVEGPKVRAAIIHLLKGLETRGGRRVGPYSLAFSGASCHGKTLKGVSSLLGGKALTSKDIAENLEIIEEGPKQQGLSVLHNLPRVYCLDGKYYADPPVGELGKILEVVSHAMLCRQSSIDRLLAALQMDQYHLEEIVAGALAAGYALLPPGRQPRATLIIDFGYGKVSVTLFYLGVPYFSQVYQLGSYYILKDVCEVLDISFAAASGLLEQHGGCFQDMLTLVEQLSVEGRVFTQGRLCQVIFARVEEILLLIRNELNQSGIIVDRLEHVILCGGGSRLKGLAGLVEKILGPSVSLGVPSGIEGGREHWASPAYATVVGLGLYLFHRQQTNPSGLGEWLKKIFA